MLKFVSLIFCLSILTTPVNLNAQQKIAYIDYNQLLLSMPETKEAEKDFNKYVESWNAMYTVNVKEYMMKDSLFNIDSSKWAPNMKDLKKSELEQLRERIKMYSESFEQDTKNKNEHLMQPVYMRAQTAVEAVVKENGYANWIDKTELAKYPGATDIMALVKMKLASTPNLTTTIQFEHTDINLGIGLEEKVIEYDIKFTNTGNAPLTISSASSSSGSVKLQWPQKAIKSGESGIIKLTYDAVNSTGRFDKSIKVISNAKESPNYLEISGYVGSYLKNQLSEQFLKIMKAYPGNFESLKDGLSNAATSEYFSKISIEQSRRTAVLKGKGYKNYVLSLIGSYDSKEKGLQKYQELLKIINTIKLNGAALKVYQNEQTETLTSTRWRLDNATNNTNNEYSTFTIELICMHMDKTNAGVTIKFGAE
jgi:outer membrane protein